MYIFVFTLASLLYYIFKPQIFSCSVFAGSFCVVYALSFKCRSTQCERVGVVLTAACGWKTLRES